MASVGFDAAVVEDLSQHRGNSITHFSYVMPFIRQLLKWNPPTITIHVDGEEIASAKSGWAVVANSKAYARGLNPARTASVFDGKLDVVFFPLKGRLSLLKWIRLLKRGTHFHHPDIVFVKGEHVRVVTEEESPWQVDGDAIGRTNQMEFVCVPKSLNILQ